MTGFYVYLSLIANLFWLIWFDFFCRWHIAKRRAPGEDFKLGSLLLSAPGQDRIQPILNKHSSKFTQTSAWQYFKLIMRNFHSPTSSPFSLNWNISYLPLALCVSVRLSCQRALSIQPTLVHVNIFVSGFLGGALTPRCHFGINTRTPQQNSLNSQISEAGPLVDILYFWLDTKCECSAN